MSLFDEIRAKSSSISAIAKACGVSDIRVFGSVARGEEREDSDIDFLVNVERVDNPFWFLDFQTQVSKLFSRNVDIVF